MKYSLTPARFSQRIYALLIDWSIIYGITLGAALALDSIGIAPEIRGPIYAIFLLVALFAYDPGLVWFCGQTAGHRILGIKVVREDGARVTFISACVRFVAKLVIGIWSFFWLFSRQRRALHDSISGTRVVSV